MKRLMRKLPPFLKSYARSATIWAVKLFPNSFKNFVIPSGIKSYKDFAYTTIYPSSLSKLQIPKTVHEEVNPRFLENLEPSPEAVVLSLQGGISTGFGANLTESGVLIKELSPEMGVRHGIEKHVIFSSVRVFSVKKYNNSVVTFTTHRQGVTYFHWLFNVLPKIHLVEKSGLKFDKIYIEVQKRFQEETIKLLGYESEQIIDSSKCNYLSASQLIIPSLPDYKKPSRITDWSCDFLRQKFLNCIPPKPKVSKSKTKRIYISRADAKFRKITNEPEVIHFLQEYGFNIIKLEYLSFLDQVSLFRDAEVVVASHGAGITNIVFCSEKTKVIEIFAPKFVNLCYWYLSCHVGLDYYYLFGEGEPLNYYEARFNNDNMEVDLNKLRKTFELASISLQPT